MAEHDSKSEAGISKAQRRLKVGYVSKQHINSKTGLTSYYSRHPGLYLKGDWLGEAGFATGQPVRVMVEPGRLVILTEVR
ncbi:SymE family type I addiction module toxin [Sodalis sp. RH16]|uniref:SymE family type I addiction module toxin n=1 Tax=Sodalis sp. RH16 TaxID=3394331 RepID=UPI0039B6C553